MKKFNMDYFWHVIFATMDNYSFKMEIFKSLSIETSAHDLEKIK